MNKVRHLDWTSPETLEGEKLAYFGVIPLAAFACTFWLVVVNKPIIFAMIMIISIVATAFVVRNRKGTRIVIDDKVFRFGTFQRIPIKKISSVAIVRAAIGSSDLLGIGIYGDQESETFNMKGVPDEVRSEILKILEFRINSP